MRRTKRQRLVSDRMRGRGQNSGKRRGKAALLKPQGIDTRAKTGSHHQKAGKRAHGLKKRRGGPVKSVWGCQQPGGKPQGHRAARLKAPGTAENLVCRGGGGRGSIHWRKGAGASRLGGGTRRDNIQSAGAGQSRGACLTLGGKPDRPAGCEGNSRNPHTAGIFGAGADGQEIQENNHRTKARRHHGLGQRAGQLAEAQWQVGGHPGLASWVQPVQPCA